MHNIIYIYVYTYYTLIHIYIYSIYNVMYIYRFLCLYLSRQFLDEPTSGLDSTASLVLVQQLKRMAKLGMTIIMIIHQPCGTYSSLKWLLRA